MPVGFLGAVSRRKFGAELGCAKRRVPGGVPRHDVRGISELRLRAALKPGRVEGYLFGAGQLSSWGDYARPTRFRGTYMGVSNNRGP